MWHRDDFSRDVQDLYEFVTPDLDQINEGILLQRDWDKYQLWTHREQDNLVAMALVMPLDKTQTLHIDIFAINPDYRHQHRSFDLLTALQKEIGSMFGCARMSIEAYYHNVNYFQKFGFKPTIDYKPLWISENNVKWLVTGDPPTDYTVDQMIQEWQTYQQTWGKIGYQY